MKKWALVIIFFLISLITATTILTIMGIISPQETLGKWAERIPVFKPHIETYRAGLESEEWRANQYEAIMEEKESIEAERKDLEIEKAHIAQQWRDLERREAALQRQQGEFELQVKRQQNLAKLAELYEEMAAQEGARIIQELDEEDIVTILTQMDTRQASQILSILPTDLAARVSSRFKDN